LQCLSRGSYSMPHNHNLLLHYINFFHAMLSLPYPAAASDCQRSCFLFCLHACAQAANAVLEQRLLEAGVPLPPPSASHSPLASRAHGNSPFARACGGSSSAMGGSSGGSSSGIASTRTPERTAAAMVGVGLRHPQVVHDLIACCSNGPAELPRWACTLHPSCASDACLGLHV
jgi:hypothetical protein